MNIHSMILNAEESNLQLSLFDDESRFKILQNDIFMSVAKTVTSIMFSMNFSEIISLRCEWHHPMLAINRVDAGSLVKQIMLAVIWKPTSKI